MQLRHTDVDGVPVVWVAAQGPLRAGLLFRVGRCDETLATGGVTHYWNIWPCTRWVRPIASTTV
jgi:hypothetical protein